VGFSPPREGTLDENPNYNPLRHSVPKLPPRSFPTHLCLRLDSLSSLKVTIWLQIKQWIPFSTRTAGAKVKRAARSALGWNFIKTKKNGVLPVCISDVLPLIPTLSPLLHLPNRTYLPSIRPDAYTRNIACESSQRINPRNQSQ